MRIVSGIYRGKKLFSPLGEHVRPTADRAKEAVFNILSSRLNWNKCRVADIFCGSGALGLEALSRGAPEICLVDLDLSSAAKNIALFPNERNKIKQIKGDARQLPPAKEPYDVIFMDAPYNKNLTLPALQNLQEKNWLKPDTLCVVEVEKSEKLDIPQNFEVLDERLYGLAKVFLLCPKF